MAEPLLELEAIETCYGQSQVLFGISLSIAAGEMVTLMGRNGMGKTTTVRSIMGLTPAMAGAACFTATGKSGRQKRRKPYAPVFAITPAMRTTTAVGASL